MLVGEYNGVILTKFQQYIDYIRNYRYIVIVPNGKFYTFWTKMTSKRAKIFIKYIKKDCFICYTNSYYAYIPYLALLGYVSIVN